MLFFNSIFLVYIKYVIIYEILMKWICLMCDALNFLPKTNKNFFKYIILNNRVQNKSGGLPSPNLGLP